jgi:hypothetical protein
MNKMKKSQISFEFILLFTIAMFVFVLSISFFMDLFQNTDFDSKEGGDQLDELKFLTIIASLSESDVETSVTLPEKINEISIEIELYDNPDNMAIIKNKDDGSEIAKVFLPVIDDVITTDPDGRKITIKKVGSTLKLEKTAS